MSKVVLLLRGLPASGKTTWAKKLQQDNPNQYKRVNKDDLRAMLDDSRYAKSNEKMVIELRNNIILKSLEEGKHVIVDDTNFNTVHEKDIRSLVGNLATVSVKSFCDVPIEEILQRNKSRENKVPEKVIMDMYHKYIFIEKGYHHSVGLESAYIFDIDGTLAIKGDRSPYEWDKVGLDTVNLGVKKMLNILKQNHKIILCSGRDGVCLPETKLWLQKNDIHFDLLSMRNEGDTRSDYIVKKEMFYNIKNEYNIEGVFDDRDQVVRMWRENGVTCFQVNYGNF